MREKQRKSTIHTVLVFLIACVLAWGGVPAPALAEMAEEATREDVAAQPEGGRDQQGDAADADNGQARDNAGSVDTSEEPDGPDGRPGAAAGDAPSPAVEEATAGDDVPQAADEGAALAAQSDEADGPALSAQSVSVSNPRVVANSSMTSGQVATWDCVWFGSYPQTEVGPEDAAYASLQSAEWDASGDATVGGARYRRISKSDATYSGKWSSDGYGSATYRYFKYEPIKWRVLETSNGKALVVADKALDGQYHNKRSASVTWETSSLRSWLNGYGASSNQPGIDYSNKSFVGAAFSPDELTAVPATSVANANNTSYGTAGGNNTQDKVFLLSESEVHGNPATAHGFASGPGTYDEARRCKASDYAHAMGASRSTSSGYEGNCDWWLRSPGYGASYAAHVIFGGYVSRYGDSVNNFDFAVRPALSLDLSSPLISHAGTVSSDGAADEEGIIPITSVELGESSYAYDGQNAPAVAAVRAGDAYVPSSGYDVSYLNNAGVGMATVTVVGKGPYAGTASANYQITPRPVTVTADDKSKPLGAADPELTATVDGLVGDDTVGYTLSRAKGEGPGEYAITPSGAAEQGNYAVTYVAGKLAITASVSGASVAPIPDQTFTGSAIEPAVAVTLGGRELVPGTDYELSYANNVNAGTATVTVTGKGNYEGAKDVEFRIAPRPVTVTADNKSKALGAADPELTATAAGLVGDDTVSYSLSRAPGNDAGEYAITPSGEASQGNYAVTYVPGKLTINKASISGAAVAPIPDQTYKGSAIEPKPAVTLDGEALREGTDYELSYASNVDVGTATATVTGRGNYEGSLTAEFRIDRASVEVPVAKSGLVYSGEPQTGIEAGEGYVLGGDSTATDAGDYTATATPDANHAWPDGATGSKGLGWSIARKPVTVRGRDATKEFGADDPVASELVDIEGLLGNDVVQYAVNRQFGEALGDYVTTPSGAAEQGNYSVTYVPGKLTITRADVANAEVAPIEGKYRTGDAITPLPVVSMRGTPLALGTDYALSYANNLEPGTATVTITGAGNYAGTKDVDFRIALRPVTVSADDKRKALGADDPELTATVTGLVGDDSVSYSLSRAPGSDAGEYAITPTGDAEQGNYAVTYVPGKLTIERADVANATVAPIKGCVYDGKPYEPKPKVTLGGRTLVEKTDYTLSYRNNVSASNGRPATVIVTGRGNYTGTKEASFEVWKNGQPMEAWAVARQAPAASLKARDVTVEAPIHVAHAVSAAKPMEYRKTGGDSRLNVELSTGRVTIRKGTSAGTYKVTIRAIAFGGSNYADGSRTVECQVKVVSGAKMDQSLEVKAADVTRTAASLASADYLTRPFSVAMAAGNVTYKWASGSGCLSVDSAGRLRVAKGTRAGTYYAKVWATAAGDAGYKPCTRTVSVKVVVR